MSKDDNRRKMPATANLIDQFREVFGSDTKIVRAIEDGPEGRCIVGKFTPEEIEIWSAVDLQSVPDPPQRATEVQRYTGRKVQAVARMKK